MAVVLSLLAVARARIATSGSQDRHHIQFERKTLIGFGLSDSGVQEADRTDKGRRNLCT